MLIHKKKTLIPATTGVVASNTAQKLKPSYRMHHSKKNQKPRHLHAQSA
jgi:hypothetical protein